MSDSKEKEEVLSHAKLVEYLEYNSSTGVFTWRVNNLNKYNQFGGKEAGYTRSSGYVEVRIDTVLYLAHRLAWFYFYKKWPALGIDHIDKNPSNNAINNLREANQENNGLNRYKNKNNTSGYKGVSYDKARDKFSAEITVRGVRYRLGRFNSAIEASEAYNAKARELSGEFYYENTFYSRPSYQTRSKECTYRLARS